MDLVCSKWLAAARWDGGLLIPGRARSRAAALRIGASGIEVIAGLARARLAWAPIEWSVEEYSRDRMGQAVGIALHVEGAALDATAEVRDVQDGLLSRLDRTFGEGTVVALFAAATPAHRHVRRDTRLVDLLLRVLAARADARDRLADAARVARLVDDLRTWRPPDHRRSAPVGRRAFEVDTTLRMADFVHRWDGRPLPGDALPSADEVTDSVLARLGANPHVDGIAFDRDEVRAQICRTYTDVAPWPFAALTV